MYSYTVAYKDGLYVILASFEIMSKTVLLK